MRMTDAGIETCMDAMSIEVFLLVGGKHIAP
jgi:hypothetical protein